MLSRVVVESCLKFDHEGRRYIIVLVTNKMANNIDEFDLL